MRTRLRLNEKSGISDQAEKVLFSCQATPKNTRQKYIFCSSLIREDVNFDFENYAEN